MLHLHSIFAEPSIVQASLHVKFIILLLVAGNAALNEQLSVTCLHR